MFLCDGSSGFEGSQHFDHGDAHLILATRKEPLEKPLWQAVLCKAPILNSRSLQQSCACGLESGKVAHHGSGSKRPKSCFFPLPDFPGGARALWPLCSGVMFVCSIRL